MRTHRTLFRPALAICAGIVALTTAVPSVAVADPLQPVQFDYRGGVPPHEVGAIVRSMGFNPVGPPLRRGRDYVQHAVDRRGEQVRVIVDARFGDVVAVRRVYARGPYEYGRPDYARRSYDDDRPDYARRMPRPYYRDDDDDFVPRPPAIVGPPPVRGYEPDPRVVTVPPQQVPPTDGPRVIYGPRDREIKDPPRNAAPPPPPPDRRSLYVPPGTTTPAPAQAKRTPLPKSRPNLAAVERPVAAPPIAPAAPAAPSGPVVGDVAPAPSVAPSPGQFPADAPPLDE